MSYIPANLTKVTERPGDYWGDDGLLYCGKCNTPRSFLADESYGELAGRLMHTPCKCGREAEAVEKEVERVKRVEQLRERCLPLSEMRAARFEDADESKAVDIARRYVGVWEKVRAENIGLLFCGNTGSGKSYAALCICNALIEREVAARYISVTEAVSAVREGGEVRQEIEKHVKGAPLLVLDDYGAEGSSDYSQSLVCQLIDLRSRSGKPLIVTTNFPLSMFQGKPDELHARAADRIAGMCVPVSVTGESRRARQAADKLRRAKEILGL